jgi:hypothetical protein
MQAAAVLGQQVADELRQAGADAMLERMRKLQGERSG